MISIPEIHLYNVSTNQRRKQFQKNSSQQRRVRKRRPPLRIAAGIGRGRQQYQPRQLIFVLQSHGQRHCSSPRVTDDYWLFEVELSQGVPQKATLHFDRSGTAILALAVSVAGTIKCKSAIRLGHVIEY